MTAYHYCKMLDFSEECTRWSHCISNGQTLLQHLKQMLMSCRSYSRMKFD
ncbi:hypothetical protein [Acinetobacter baumannii]